MKEEPLTYQIPDVYFYLIIVEKTVILDLDETLIHCNESLQVPHDVSLNIRFPTGEKIDAGVNIRPFAIKFLE